MKTSLIGLLAGLFLTLSTNVTIADWVLVQDFEGATYADFDLHKRYPPQGDLFLFGADPDDFSNGHYYANPGDPQLDGSSNQIWNSMTLPTPVAEGATATIKYDLYFFTAGPHNLNIGLSAIEVAIDDTLSKEDGQLLQPITYDAFESQAAWTAGNFQFRDAGDFAYADYLYPIGEWFTMYCVIDNSADRTYFYYKTASMTVPVHVPLPESDFALVIAFESKFVNGEIIILSVPASFIDGNAILYACVTSPLDVSTAPTGTSTTIGLFARH